MATGDAKAAQSANAPGAELDAEVLLADYRETVGIIRMLAEIRFKLVALLPTLTGAAVALLEDNSPATKGVIGLMGLVATIGVLAYEIRNTSLYDSAVGRAKRLEGLLKLPAFVAGREFGGVMRERPGSVHQKVLFMWEGRPFCRFYAKHDHGLALIYSATVAAWGFLVGSGLTASAMDSASSVPKVVGAIIAGVLFVVTFWQLYLMDRNRSKMDVPESEPEPVREVSTN